MKIDKVVKVALVSVTCALIFTPSTEIVRAQDCQDSDNDHLSQSNHDQLNQLMARVTNYIILEDSDPDGLSKMVNNALKSGYQPLGGVSISDRQYFQAMGR